MKSSRILAVAALCVATGFAGCGDDDPKPADAGTTPAAVADAAATPTPQSPADAPDASPTEKWAKTTCDKLAAGMKALQPPDVTGTSPDDTKASLVTFFTQLADQLGNQGKILDEVGPPPGPNGAREYKAAMAELAEVRGKLEQVVSRVEKSAANSKGEVDALVLDLGESLKVMGEYDGPIAQLIDTRSLGKALAAEPGCAALSQGAQATS